MYLIKAKRLLNDKRQPYTVVTYKRSFVVTHILLLPQATRYLVDEVFFNHTEWKAIFPSEAHFPC